MLKHKGIGFLKAAVAGFLCIVLAGCAPIRITTGSPKSEFLQLEGSKIGMDCAMMLLGEQRYIYEDLFDEEVWDKEVEGVTMAAYVKGQIKDDLEHLIVLNRMAKEMGISLTEEENRLLELATKEYWDTVSEVPEIAFTEETVRSYYKDLLMAQKTFYAVTDSVDEEVSVDEARIIDVQYLFFSKYEEDEDGKRTLLSEAGCNKVRSEALQLLEQLQGNEDFSSYALEYSDDSNYFLEFGRGEYDKTFEDAAFGLEAGQVSDLVETEYGFYIIKCTNDNVPSDYENRKAVIILKRRMELFSTSYEAYMADKQLYYNELYWNKYPVGDAALGSGALQTIFEQYFVSTQ